MRTPPTIHIKARTLAEAWAKAVKKVMREGIVISTEYGPLSRDVCSLIEVTHPQEEPMLHPQFPTKQKHLQGYLKQWERDYDWKAQGFEYNYLDRLTHPLDQLQAIRELLPQGVSRRRQAITWIPRVDLKSEHPPCLQRIWLRNLGDSQVEVHCTWRSRDLYSAWNTNLIGIIRMLEREILKPNNLKLARLVDFCNSLHIYEADWPDAEKVKPIGVNPQYSL